MGSSVAGEVDCPSLMGEKYKTIEGVTTEVTKRYSIDRSRTRPELGYFGRKLGLRFRENGQHSLPALGQWPLHAATCVVNAECFSCMRQVRVTTAQSFPFLIPHGTP